MVGVLVAPFSMVTLLQGQGEDQGQGQGHWATMYGGFLCGCNAFLNAVCIYTTIHTLMYISIQRYFPIVRPLGPQLPVRAVGCMMAAAWLWACLLSAVTVSQFGYQHREGTAQCGPRDTLPEVALVIGATGIIIPFFEMVFCYGRMFLALHQHKRRIHDNSTVGGDVALTKQRRITFTLFIVIAVFFCMVMLPYLFLAADVASNKDPGSVNIYVNPLAYMCVFMNSMLNPVIYACRFPAFRHGYNIILRRGTFTKKQVRKSLHHLRRETTVDGSKQSITSVGTTLNTEETLADVQTYRL